MEEEGKGRTAAGGSSGIWQIVRRSLLGAILVLLLAGMGVKYYGTRGGLGHVPETAVRGHIENHQTMLSMYHRLNGFLPTTEQGLRAMVAKPETEPRPTNWRQLTDAPIMDPWQQEYFYVQPGQHRPSGYDLFSTGPDRKPGTADDLGNWEKTN